MSRYVIRGTVRDVNGNPIEGAALDVGGEVVYTNSTGEFFLRVGRPRNAPVTVLLTDFLLPGRWEVVSAPAQAQAGPENGVKGIEIILQRPATEPK